MDAKTFAQESLKKDALEEKRLKIATNKPDVNAKRIGRANLVDKNNLNVANTPHEDTIVSEF